MNDEKIKVRVTETGQTMEVVVLSKRAERIQVVLGEGVHSVKCELTPTRTGRPMRAVSWGARSCTSAVARQVQADIDRLNPVVRKSGRR